MWGREGLLSLQSSRGLRQTGPVLHTCPPTLKYLHVHMPVSLQPVLHMSRVCCPPELALALSSALCLLREDVRWGWGWGWAVGLGAPGGTLAVQGLKHQSEVK